MAALSSGLCRPGIILYLALVILATRHVYSAPVYENESSQVAEYEGGASGCYYNFQHYQEGARIITNEPCLNCTCHNRMLMCYLRVCPFTKAIGQDCKVEKRPDQCCPIITCPEVPVQLLTSTTSSPSKTADAITGSTALATSSSSPASTELGFPDSYGCNVNERFYADGAQLPVDANNPCELCYCIRNKTTCLMQQCTLSVAGCRPVYQPGICCPVKYNCEYDEESMAATTPGLIMTTTIAPHSVTPQCHHEGKLYEDGELIYTIQPCQHCYCFHGDIVCAVQECGKPMESHGKNCTALPPLDGECCPTTYQCEDDFGNIATEIPEIADKKDAAEEPEINKAEEDQKESFPGADNAIPEEIPTTSTERPQTVSPLGNEVPESEPTKAAATDAPADQLPHITEQPERETEAPKSPEIKEADHSEATPFSELTSATAIDEASEKPTESEQLVPQTTEEPEKEPAEMASELPPRIGDVDEDKEKSTELSETSSSAESTPSSLDAGALTESNVIAGKAEMTEATQGEDTESSLGQDELTNTVSTEEEQVQTTASSSVEEDNVGVTQSEVFPTEKLAEPTAPVSEATEKSSEISSPVSETVEEEDVKKDATESTLSSSSTDATKAADSTEKLDLSSEMDQFSTIKPTFESTQVSEAATTVSFEEEKPKDIDSKIAPESTTSSSIEEESDKTFVPMVTDAPSADLSPSEKEKPEGSDAEVTPESITLVPSDEETQPKEAIPEITVETSTGSSIDEESAKTIEPAATDASSAAPPSENEKPEESVAEVTPESVTLAPSDEEHAPEKAIPEVTLETSTGANTDEESGKTVEPTATDAPPAVPSSEEEKTEENAGVTSEMTTLSALDEENKPKDQESSKDQELLLASTPSSVDEISEKSDADETLTQSPKESTPEENVEKPKTPEQGPTGIPIPDRVPEHKAEDKDAVTDSAITEGYQPTGSGMPNIVDSLITEAPESGPTTYLPPVGSSTEERQPSTPLYEDLPKQDEVEGQTTELAITPKTPSDKTTVGVIDEVSPTKGEFDNTPMEENISDEELTAAKTSSPEVSSTSSPVTDEMNNVAGTETPTKAPSVDEITLSDISTEKSLPKKDDAIETKPEDLPESGQEEESATKSSSAETSAPEIEVDATRKPEDSSASQPTEKSIEQEPIDESAVTSSPAISSEEPETGSNVEHSTDMPVSSTEAELIEEKSVEASPTEIPSGGESETDKPVSSEGPSEATSEPNKEDIEKPTTESTIQPIDEVRPLPEQPIDDIREKSTEESVESGDQTTPSIETKLNDQETPKETVATEPTIESKPDESTSTTLPVTGSATDELTSAINISEESTEVTVASSQTPEVEIELSTPTEERPSGIPGEGNCLVDGQSYTNNSAIPPPDACHMNCRCVSSQVNCDQVKCSPPPADVPNCTPIFEPNMCCPMYTCESTPSVQPEADNQMSDHHTSTSADENLTSTQKAVLDETTDATEKTPTKVETEIEVTTLSSVKSDQETTPTEPEFDKENASTSSPVDEEISSSIIPESTSSSTGPEISIKIGEDEPSVSEDGKSQIDEENLPSATSETPDVEEENISGTTLSIQSSSTETTEGKDKLPDDETSKPTEKISLDSAEPTDESPKLEEGTVVSTEPSAGSEDLATNVPDQDVTTPSSTPSESEAEKAAPIEPSQEPELTEKTEEVAQPEEEITSTVAPLESVDAETQKSVSESSEAPTASPESELTSAITYEGSTPSTVEQTEKSEPEIEKEPASTEINLVSSSETPAEPSATKSSDSETSTESDLITQKPEDAAIEPEVTVTSVEEESKTSADLEPIATDTETKKPEDSLATESGETDTPKDTSDATESIESSSTTPSMSTEKDLTVPVIIGTEEEQAPPLEPEVTGTPVEAVPEEPSETINVPHEPELIATTESIEVESASSEGPSTVSSSDESTPEAKPSDEKEPDETPIEAKPESESTESEEAVTVKSVEQPEIDMEIEKVTEKSEEEKPETTKPETEKSEEEKSEEEKPEGEKPGTEKSEEEKPEEHIPEEHIPEEEKPKPDTTESTSEAAGETQTVSEETITLSTSTDVEESDAKEKPTESSVTEANTEISKVEESSSPISEEPIEEDQKSPAPDETSTEAVSTKDKIDEPEETTSVTADQVIPLNEKPITDEPTKVEAYPDDETSQGPDESPDKELTSAVTTEPATSATSSSEAATSDKSAEKEYLPSVPSASEEPTALDTGSSTSEMSSMASTDAEDQSTKASVPTDEQSSVEPSEAITPEDDQYHVDQQTEEPVMPGVQDEEEQKPIEDHTSTIHPETSKPHTRPDFPDQHMPETDDASIFPPDGADISPDETEPETDDYDDQAVYGPGTCRYGGKIYMSAQQIPRDDACDFCFCFRSDIICLQQSCPPPIPGCHEEPIGGFCCPRYECPVSMATSLNVTTTTTTTTTTVPPHFLSHAYKGSAVRGGCQIGNKAYRVGEDIKSKSGPCMSCTCGGDGKMKCEPKACSASPMLKEMIAHAAAKKRRR